MASVHALYSEALSSTRAGALYNAFSYPTKISAESIALFIATHTKPGDLVLDPFAGSGTTGLGALLCEKPTAAMLASVRRLGIDARWGPRRVVLVELSAIGSLVSRVLCTPPDHEAFAEATAALLGRVEQDLAELYRTHDDRGNVGVVRHVIWSERIRCQRCEAPTTYWDAVVRRDPLRLLELFACHRCGHEQRAETAERLRESYWDGLIGETVHSRERVPVWMYGRTETRAWSRPADERDVSALRSLETQDLPRSIPTSPIFWGDLFRSGYHSGITHTHHFYTRRSLLALGAMWEAIEDAPHTLRDALRAWILSYNASHATLMTRVVVKQGDGDFAVTGAQSGVLYISSLPVEKNIFEGLRRKRRTFMQAFDRVEGLEGVVRVVHGSSTDLDLSDATVDYIFTDPPFGDFIPYSELNQINESWLGRVTERAQEAIISRAQGKGLVEYGELLSQVFREMRRVLTPNGAATVVFHSAKATVWQALMNAYKSAGFDVEQSSVLARTQKSFKQVVSSGGVKGEPLFLLRPVAPSRLLHSDPSDDDDVWAVLHEARFAESDEERNVHRLYSRYAARCLEQGKSVALDAAAFYERVTSVIYASSEEGVVG